MQNHYITLEIQLMNYYGKYFTFSYDSEVVHIVALMLEWEYGIEEEKYKSLPFPVSWKESKLSVKNQTVLLMYLAFLLFELFLGKVGYQG